MGLLLSISDKGAEGALTGLWEVRWRVCQRGHCCPCEPPSGVPFWWLLRKKGEGV